MKPHRRQWRCAPWLGRFAAYLVVVTLFVVIVIVLGRFGLPWPLAIGVPTAASAAALRVIRVIVPARAA